MMLKGGFAFLRKYYGNPKIKRGALVTYEGRWYTIVNSESAHLILRDTRFVHATDSELNYSPEQTDMTTLVDRVLDNMPDLLTLEADRDFRDALEALENWRRGKAE